MKNTMPSKKWLISFLCIFLTLVLIVGLTAYLVDPFYQFRYGDNAHFINTAKFPGPGLVKNYEYDTLIIGSSMTQNFDMDVFRQELGCDPLHIGIGGIGLEELLSYIELSEQAGKCEAYYIGIDQYMLADPIDFITPEYLIRNDTISTLRYLFSYEAWFRYIPLDIALGLIRRLPVTLPEKIRQAVDVDYMGNWENDYVFGEDAVIRNYLRNDYGVSSVETDGLYERMTEWTDKLIEGLPGDKTRYHFFFPPYSVLFWYDAQNDGYLDEYLQIKQYFREKANAYGIQVYDFQSADFVFDLDYYRDMTHYRGEINDWMVHCFARGDYLASTGHIEQGYARIISGIDTFAKSYHGILEKNVESD